MSATSTRVALVTGGTDGIGKAVALRLAEAGDQVLFVGRDERRGQGVLRDLQVLQPRAAHAFIRADLSRLGDTARVADEVAALGRLDAVVCCAGILSTIPEYTDEELERSFVLNYLSRYLLVRRLQGRLFESASGRVVLVANAGKYRDTLDLEDLQHRKGRSGLHVAGRTQFANDLLATELAMRVQGTRIEVSCVFPGIVRTGVFAHARGLPWFARFLTVLLRCVALEPMAAAETPLFLARDPRAVGSNGRFWGPHCKERAVPQRARNEARRQALWQASEALVSRFLEPAVVETAPPHGARM